MSKLTKERILQATVGCFAQLGSGKFSIRQLTKKLGTSPSSVYYYFKNESDLLWSMFAFANHELGVRRAALPECPTASDMLRQRIEFQIDNQQTIVAVLKCYLHLRTHFQKFEEGFLPDKSALHMEEVLIRGTQTGEFSSSHMNDDAKVMTHAVNGYLLEYYPYRLTLTEKQTLVERIHSFFLRALGTV